MTGDFSFAVLNAFQGRNTMEDSVSGILCLELLVLYFVVGKR